MDIHITYTEGPIEVEISATEDENYSAVLDQIAEFAEEHNFAEDSQELVEQVGAETEELGEDTSEEVQTESSRSNSSFSEVDASDTELQRVLKTGTVEGNNIEEYPEIIGDADILGDSGERRLLNGAIVLLTILDDIHGISRVKTSDLKDALGESGLNKDNWSNIGRPDETDVYLNRRGKGASATTEIRGPGKSDAYDYIQYLVDDFRSDRGNDSD